MAYQYQEYCRITNVAHLQSIVIELGEGNEPEIRDYYMSGADIWDIINDRLDQCQINSEQGVDDENFASLGWQIDFWTVPKSTLDQ